MAKRKTIEVKRLIEIVNERNKHSFVSDEVRRGWNAMLENILFEVHAYRGYRYLEAYEVPNNELPGIVWHEPTSQGAARMAKEFPDETRREYIISHKLIDNRYDEKLLQIFHH